LVKKSIIEQFFAAEKNLTLLNKKVAIIKNWQNTILDKTKILKHKDNLGWVLGDFDFVLDVDLKDNGHESFKKLLNDLNIDKSQLLPTVYTARGGFHIYMKLDKKYKHSKFKKKLKEYKGIDFLTKGSYCVIPGSKTNDGEYIWADDLFQEFNQINVPKVLIDLLIKEEKTNEKTDEKELTISDIKWPREQVLKLINKLNPSMQNDDWVKVGMALHEWDNVDGLQIWEEWSKNGENYIEGETEKRWKSFNSGGGVTLGSISYMAKLADFDSVLEKVNSYINKIKYADEKSIEFELIPNIKKENFSTINIEKLVKSIQNRLKDITQVKVPVNSIRQKLSRIEIIEGDFIEKTEKPKWCENWVYVNAQSAFINLNDLTIHKSESFNIENGKYVPISENGSKPSATKFISDNGFIEKAESLAYLPSIEEKIITLDDRKIVNTFNVKSIPEEAEKFTNDGIEAINMIKNHIKFLCSTDENSKILTQWLASQVQFPGKQVLWSPVIQSIQGIGKSFFGELLRACLGDRNVGTVSPNQVCSDYNSWATNVCVNVLEELRVKGSNRYEIANALKPLITDRIIQINGKHDKQYSTYNTTNYICFTNYKDFLPLDSEDRRWWVIFAPINSLSELKEYVGIDHYEYFPKLFNSIRKYKSEIRKWMLEYKITNEFLNTKQAPQTEFKLAMINTEDASHEGFIEIKELIKKGGRFFNEKVISSSDLYEKASINYPDLILNNTQKSIILKKLGYISLGVIKINRQAKRLWAKSPLAKETARDLLINNKKKKKRNK